MVTGVVVVVVIVVVVDIVVDNVDVVGNIVVVVIPVVVVVDVLNDVDSGVYFISRKKFIFQNFSNKIFLSLLVQHNQDSIDHVGYIHYYMDQSHNSNKYHSTI